MATPLLEIEGTWEDLTQYAAAFAGRRLRFVVLPADNEPPASAEASARHAPTARELLKLPLEERNRILAQQAAHAEYFYRNDPDLTDFEVFGDDIYDETP